MTTGTLSATVPEMDVISAKRFEEECKQPIAIATATSMLVMAVVKIISMFALFTKLNKAFNPSHISARLRQKNFVNRVRPCNIQQKNNKY